MPARDLDLLIEAARAAGEVASRYAGPEAKRWDKPDDAGPVTEADLAVDRLLRERLMAARPDYGWLSEETEDNADRLSAERVFIVDPIDGTRSFIEGSSTWAHAIAVAEHGVVTAAVVYLPMRDLMYVAGKGQGAFLNEAPLTVSGRAELSGASVLAAKPGFQAQHWRQDAPDVKRGYRPSLAYRQCLVAEGRFDAMFTLRPTWEWDIAAGDLILQEAGAVTSDRAGERLVFNSPQAQLDGVVVGNADMQGQITRALIYGASSSKAS